MLLVSTLVPHPPYGRATRTLVNLLKLVEVIKRTKYSVPGCFIFLCKGIAEHLGWNEMLFRRFNAVPFLVDLALSSFPSNGFAI